MARPKEYAVDEVLAKAMTVFWRQGYAATSMADLYAATGLKPGNLYATFTDKETLFRRAFEAYVEHFRATLPAGSTGWPRSRPGWRRRRVSPRKTLIAKGV